MPNTVHYCTVCGSGYSRLEDAEYCESAGTPEPKFNPGDTVYVDDYSTRRVEPRLVVTRVLGGHEWLYSLDMPYSDAHGRLWGVAGPRNGVYAGRCHEEQLLAEMPEEKKR